MDLDLGTKHDLMLLDMFMQQDNVDGKYKKVLNIIYRDLETDEKKLAVIEDPKVPLYFTKEKFRDFSHNKSFSLYDECDVVEVSSSFIYKKIAEVAGGNIKATFDEAKENRDWQGTRMVLKYPYVFGADIPVDVIYRRLWRDNYENERPKKITKGFLDIEVDTIESPGMPEYGTMPINAVSIISEPNMTCYTLLLRNDKNPQIAEFEKNVDKFIEELHDDFDEFYGKLDYKIYMYDEERQLIKDIFNLVNSLKMDVVLIWNGGGFDIPYIIERCIYLGMDPNIIMTHPDFPIRKIKYEKDTINFKVADKSDSFVSSSYTKFVDHMKLYAATRKGQSELRSHSLSYISQIELQDDKLDYSEVSNMSTFPYENFAKFVKYNIKDVLLQYGIERRTSDVDGLYLRSYTTLTTYDKVFKQTVALRNRAYYELHLQDIIIGNNINVLVGSKPDRKFTGAIVGDPKLNSNTGKSIFGRLSKYIYDNVIDMDFSSMYPHIILAFNIERHTMIGKLLLLDENGEQQLAQFDVSDWMVGTKKSVKPEDIEPYLDDDEEDDDEEEFDDRYDAGKDFMDNYLTGDILALGTKWFKLPSTEYLVENYAKDKKLHKVLKYDINQPAKAFLDEIFIGADKDETRIQQ